MSQIEYDQQRLNDQIEKLAIFQSTRGSCSGGGDFTRGGKIDVNDLLDVVIKEYVWTGGNVAGRGAKGEDDMLTTQPIVDNRGVTGPEDLDIPEIGTDMLDMPGQTKPNRIWDDGIEFQTYMQGCARALKDEELHQRIDAGERDAEIRAAAIASSTLGFLSGRGFSIPQFPPPFVDPTRSGGTRSGSCKAAGDAIERFIREHLSSDSRGIGADIGDVIDKTNECVRDIIRPNK